MSEILSSQNMFYQILIQELVDKTENKTLYWWHFADDVFQTTGYSDFGQGMSEEEWSIYVSKTQTGHYTYKFILDVQRNEEFIISISEGPLLKDNKENTLKKLFDLVEVSALQLDDKVRDTLFFLQNLS